MICPYRWQFEDEQVALLPPLAVLSIALTCFPGLMNLLYNGRKNIHADFIIENLDALSSSINKLTVVVLDNARVHTARNVKQFFEIWQSRGLYDFYLPPYSPHLNIIERFWKEFKKG